MRTPNAADASRRTGRGSSAREDDVRICGTAGATSGIGTCSARTGLCTAAAARLRSATRRTAGQPHNKVASDSSRAATRSRVATAQQQPGYPPQPGQPPQQRIQYGSRSSHPRIRRSAATESVRPPQPPNPYGHRRRPAARLRRQPPQPYASRRAAAELRRQPPQANPYGQPSRRRRIRTASRPSNPGYGQPPPARRRVLASRSQIRSGTAGYPRGYPQGVAASAPHAEDLRVRSMISRARCLAPAGTIFGFPSPGFAIRLTAQGAVHRGVALLSRSRRPINSRHSHDDDCGKCLICPIIAGGAYLLVAAHGRHRAKVPPVVLHGSVRISSPHLHGRVVPDRRRWAARLSAATPFPCSAARTHRGATDQIARIVIASVPHAVPDFMNPSLAFVQLPRWRDLHVLICCVRRQ